MAAVEFGYKSVMKHRLFASAGHTHHKLRKTGAGFWLRAEKVPINPSPTVMTSAPADAAVAGPGSQVKVNSMTRVTTNQAAAEPAAIPNMAVASPRMRYSKL
jgi:hypothetical protein